MLKKTCHVDAELPHWGAAVFFQLWYTQPREAFLGGWENKDSV